MTSSRQEKSSDFLRILVVDDDAHVRRALGSLLLSRTSWQVCGEAADGLEAIEKAKALRPDVILMDVSMPHMNGLDATRVIRRDLPESKIVIISQNDPAVVSRQARYADATACVAKVDLSRSLLSTIEGIASGRNSEAMSSGSPAGKADVPTKKSADTSDIAPSAEVSPAGRSSFKVRGTEILATDTPRQYLQKLARIALDEMYQFVAVLDPKGTLLEVNRSALEGAGLQYSDVRGKPFWECFWWTVSKESQETLRRAVARTAQGEFIRYDVEVYGRANGKETIIIDFSMIPVKDEAGNVVFIVPEGRDITAKKAYEREIAQKNNDLQALLERIRELDEIKTQFFANVSHEFRTPLALIIGPADRLIRDDAGLTPEQRRESAQVIARNARMLLKHVNDLLDVAKFEAGKFKIELQDTDVASLVRLTASHFDVLAQDRNISFQVEAQEDLVCAIDLEKLQRVLMNLFSNAFKFVPDGGKVRATVRRSDKDLIVTVDDSGPGVKAELRKAIFERFRQGEGGSNRQFGGTGLGLAIAKEFIEMHHGALAVCDSDLGGACFTMTLPVIRLSQSSSAVANQPVHHLDRTVIEGFIEELRPLPSAAFEPLRVEPVEPTNEFGRPVVLVVEDNPEMNRFIAESLSQKYDVMSAFDGQQGLETALASNPTVIVTDIMMPRVSGVEMIAEIRKRPELADVPILLLTAKADEELKIKLLEDGAQDFVAKPFSEKDLLVRVANLISLKTAQDRLRDQVRIQTEELDQRNEEVLQQAEQLRELSTRLQLTQDEERRRIARELHDSAGQIITALGMTLSGVARRVVQDPSLGPPVQESEQLVQQLSKEIRTMSYLLHPPLLDESGLSEAIRWYTDGLRERSGLNIDLDISDEFGRLPAEMELALFRIVQECLTNIHRHSGSKTAAIRLSRAGGDISLKVEDTGKGIPAEKLEGIQKQRSGVGITGMRERVRHFKGVMDVRSNAGGTTISIILPSRPSSSSKRPLPGPRLQAATGLHQ
jgi:PAS domain S-box-containing protein